MSFHKSTNTPSQKFSFFKDVCNDLKNISYYNGIIALAFFLTILFVVPNTCSGQATGYLISSGPNSYTLTQGARTSAGVYKPDSTLVRTLWSAVYRTAGTYQLHWDGLDDNGNKMPAGNYIVKMIADNVVYTWMGIIGNTSDNNTGSTVHHAYFYCMTGMTVVNGTAYCSKGYSEGSPSIDKFFTAKPQQKINLLPFNTSTANTDMVTSDGNLVYWAGYDPVANTNTWVYATKVSDDSNFTFASGVLFKPTYIGQYSAVGYLNQANSIISGLAVQKRGNFLFIARAGLNQLSVLDKTTGAFVQNIQIINPKSLCVDMNDNLWMTSGTGQIAKYAVGANGTLSAPLLTITSVIQPIALAVSPDNTTIAIADGGIASQQVKAFSNTTANPLWTLGTPGGYMQDATVTNNKFYFNDVRGIMYAGSGTPGFLTFIAFQPDGSFWVNDPGNYRVQHYAANRTFIETIMSMGATYSTWVDKNDNTRVGAEYLEFKIDYSQPLTGSTGWKLVKNWGANISATYDKLHKFTNMMTLTSAGVSRTFGFLRTGNFYELVEFQNNNTLRFTGIQRLHCNIDKDGSLLTDDFNRYAFTGFDKLNNPTWSTVPVVLANITLLQNKIPYHGQWVYSPYLTSSGKLVIYDYGTQLNINPAVYNFGFHLGAIQQGGTNYLWKTAIATHLDYMGAFPDAAHFDVGNNVNNNAGSAVMVLNQNIITGYHGEFWKNSQANMYNHYWDNGLAIGQFGTVGPCNVECPAMMAGNAISPQLVNGANADEMYLYHGDESYHSGMHQWKISGLHTITELDVPITYPTVQMAPAIVTGNNLMVNLPYDSPLLNNTAGWTINPTTAQTGWTIRTNALVSGAQNNPDVFIWCQSLTGAFSVNRDLGNNTGLPFWTVAGQINYYLSDQGGQMQHYFDILDNQGKIIARLTNQFTYATGNMGTNTIFANGKVLVTGLNSTAIMPIKTQFQDVSIIANKNLVTINYAGYSVTTTVFDPTADITSPRTMRSYITGGFNPTGRYFDFKDMRFISNKANQTINFSPTLVTTNLNPANTLIATSTSNLPVTFTVVSGPATIAGNTITLTSNTGVVIVQASQPGNIYYNAAPPVLQTFIVANLKIVRIDL